MANGAVVLELNSDYMMLLKEDGSFLRISSWRLPSARHVGQHVDLQELKPDRRRLWLPVMAACLLLLVLVPVLRPTPVQAWVSLDGASSLEVLVDQKFQVKDVQALNREAQYFIESASMDNWDLSALLDSYMDWSVAQGDSSFLITSTADIAPLQELSNGHQSESVEIIVLQVAPQAREEAEKRGMSAGRALFLAEAGQQGVCIPKEEITDSNLLNSLSSAGADLDDILS